MSSSALETQECCSLLGENCLSSVWVELPDPLRIVVSLERGADATAHFSELVEELQARRQAAVARERAAIEFASLLEHSPKQEDSDQNQLLEDSLPQGVKWYGLWSKVLHDIDVGTRHNPQTQIGLTCESH